MSVVRKEMPELDTLRGIAVLMVVIFHGFGYISGPYELHRFHGLAKYFVAATWFGWMGVNLFFVLSGFLITGILLQSKGRPKYFSRFYWRRALRILPAYYLLLVVLPLICLIPHFPRHVEWPFLGFSFIYLSNLVQVFGFPMQYGPLWSLAVEEHFYLLWPTVVRGISERSLALCACIIIFASPILRLVTPAADGVTWQNLDGLAMGALLAITAKGASRKTLTLASAVCTLGALVVFAAGWRVGIMKSTSWVGTAFKTTVTDAFFLGILILFLLVGTSKFAGFVNIGWLKFYGFVSYGLYLMHMLVFDMYDTWRGPVQPVFQDMTFRFFAVLGFATILCWIMRVTFEERFLRWKDRIPAEK